MRFSCSAVPASAGNALAPRFYKAFVDGCEPEDELNLELVCILHDHFEKQYPPVLLVLVLRELNPLVVLQAFEKLDGTMRRDWPFLSDENLDAINARCRYYTGITPLTHETELHNLLFELAPAPDSANGYRVKSLREVA